MSRDVQRRTDTYTARARPCFPACYRPEITARAWRDVSATWARRGFSPRMCFGGSEYLRPFWAVFGNHLSPPQGGEFRKHVTRASPHVPTRPATPTRAPIFAASVPYEGPGRAWPRCLAAGEAVRKSRLGFHFEFGRNSRHCFYACPLGVGADLKGRCDGLEWCE